jgi:hypothetical protein
VVLADTLFSIVHQGMITGTVHSTRRHGKEIENNIHLLRMACIETEQADFNSSLRHFLVDLQRSKRVGIFDSGSESASTHVRVHSRETDIVALKEMRESMNNNNIELFKTCYVSTFYLMRNATKNYISLCRSVLIDSPHPVVTTQPLSPILVFCLW